MIAIYISANQFKVSGNLTDSFKAGRRIKAACGIDGYKYSTVLSSSYAAPYTTVSIADSELTSNLTGVLYGIVNIGTEGSFPNHTHDNNEGQGGQLDFTNLINNDIGFLYLSDTPVTYSGTEDLYLKSTGSGIEFVTLSGIVGSDGTDGTAWYSGTDAPPGQALGNENDYYLNTNTYELYKKNLPSYGITDLFTGGTATAHHTRLSYYPSKAVDDSLGPLDAWKGDNLDGDIKGWWLYDFGEGVAHAFSKIRIHQVDNSGNMMCRGFTIQGSNDGINFDDLYSDEAGNIDTWYEFEFINTVPYRYLKIIITSSYTSYSGFTELETFAIESVSWQSIGNIKGAPGNDAPTTFSGLSDTPNYYDVGKYLRSTSSGIQWSEVDSSYVETFLDLTDTPSTYSGTENMYLQSTGSGTRWVEASASSVESFLDLSDTPATYEVGKYLVSTVSGIDWTTVSGSDNIFFGSGYPAINGGINNIYIDTNTGDIYQKIRESGTIIEEDVCVGGTATSDSLYSPSSNLAQDAFDDSLFSLWHSDYTTYPIYIQYQFTEAQPIGKLRMYPFASFPDRMPKDFTLKASNTGEFSGEEIDVVSYSNQTYSVGQWKEFIFDPAGAFLYYRIHIIGSNDSYQNIIEIEMMAVDVSGWELKYELKNSFLDLSDTPTTYSGTENMYLQSTGSGTQWTEIPTSSGSGANTFLELTDTPTTYSGTENLYLQSTGIGTQWAEVSSSSVEDVVAIAKRMALIFGK